MLIRWFSPNSATLSPNVERKPCSTLRVALMRCNNSPTFSGPYFWSTGSYSVGDGTWKGHLITNQHTDFADQFVRPLFGGQEVASGFSGTFTDEGSEVFGTVLVGRRSLSFRATLKRLADA